VSDELMQLAVSSAREAGALLLDRFRRPPSGVVSKSTATDLVSDADRDAEVLLRERLLGARPQDAILGEEGADATGTSGLRWVVDPLDGTVNYLFGLPAWCVSVACEDDEGGLVGAIFDPIHDELYQAARGRGAMLNGRPISVSGRETLDRAMIATGFSYSPERRARQAAVVARVLPEVRDIRRFGSAALDLAAVACGRIDGFYEVGIQHWDRAAGLLLVTEAGGITSSLPPLDGSDDGVVAAGPALHDALRELVLRAGDGSV
jgi:myo-inositol-1(or 4)-monophosphatase